MKKGFVFFIIAIILLSVAGCRSDTADKTGTVPDDGIVSGASSTLRIVIPGGKLDNTDAIIEEVNKRTANILGVRISVDFAAAEELGKTIQSAVSSGQQLDLIMDSTSLSFNQMVSEGKYAELDGLLDKYGKNILKARHDEMWNYNKVNGKIMGIPVATTYAKRYGQWYIRKDIREKLGLPAIKNNDDLMEFLYAVKQQEPDMIVSATENNFISFPGQNRIFYASKGKIRPTPAIAYSYMLYFNGNDGKVYNMFDTKDDTIWSEYRSARKLYEDGITYQNNLSGNSKDKIFYMQYGKLAAYYGAIDAKPLADLKATLRQSVSGADIEVYSEPDPPEGTVVDFKVSNFMCIPTASNNKEKAVQFLDWANQKENSDLLGCGIEGVDWKADGDGKYKALKDPFARQSLFILAASPSNLRLDSRVTAEYEAEIKKYQNPKGLTADILAGFNFDSSKVASQLQQCINLHRNYYSYIAGGQTDPDRAWEEFKKAAYGTLKDIQTELQRQIDDYLKNK